MESKVINDVIETRWCAVVYSGFTPLYFDSSIEIIGGGTKPKSE